MIKNILATIALIIDSCLLHERNIFRGQLDTNHKTFCYYAKIWIHLFASNLCFHAINFEMFKINRTLVKYITYTTCFKL